MLAYKVLINNPRTVDEAVGPQSMSSNEQLHQLLVGNTHFTTTDTLIIIILILITTTC